MIFTHPHSLLFEKKRSRPVSVTVCVSLYNYADYIRETLGSLLEQTLEAFDLAIIDDASSDASAEITCDWLKKNAERFERILLVRHDRNSGGPSAPRNTAIALSDTPFIFSLDADNTLYPRCLERCLEVIEDTRAEMVYPLIEKFGAETGILGNQNWSAEILARGNYIDNMALIRRTALEAVNGYSYMWLYGWEDFDLWCKFVEQDFQGVLVPEILARYRVHPKSLLQAHTKSRARSVTEEILERHPWLTIDLEAIT